MVHCDLLKVLASGRNSNDLNSNADNGDDGDCDDDVYHTGDYKKN